MTGPDVVVEPDADALAGTIAAALLEQVAAVQSSGRTPSLVLTGGSIADRAHRAVASAASRYRIDWSDVDLWWGDERFVSSQSADRNAGQAKTAFLDQLGVHPAHLHVMPSSDDGLDLADAAAAYAGELAGLGDGPGPWFDLLMLGVGPDGHVASLFPGRRELQEAERGAVGVSDSPKPPPERITMTYPVLNRARQVWFLVSGADKAEAVRRAMAGDAPERTPAAGVRGIEVTRWLLDEAAAGALPAASVRQAGDA